MALIGAGRAGSALAVLLARRGWPVEAIAASRLASARRLARLCGASLATVDPIEASRAADAVLIAVPDRTIPQIVRLLAASGAEGARVALHTSGAADAEALWPLRTTPLPTAVVAKVRVTSRSRSTPALSGPSARSSGPPAGPRWAVGSFHPLVAFPPAGKGPPDLRGATVAVDGDPVARRLARALAASLGAVIVDLPAKHRTRYHLAACFASNYTLTLASEATDLLAAAGWSRRRALQALLPLMRSTLENLSAQGLPDALTGPVARGDDVTIRRHVALLRRAPADLRELHRLLVRRTLRLARSGGRIDSRARRRLERALS